LVTKTGLTVHSGKVVHVNILHRIKSTDTLHRIKFTDTLVESIQI
jgi:hypothetical protein